jgi:hypothetical protein
MLGLHIAFALFGVFMLARQAPRVLALLAREDGEKRLATPAAVVTGVNVLLALLILGLAVKGLAGVLMTR